MSCLRPVTGVVSHATSAAVAIARVRSRTRFIIVISQDSLLRHRMLQSLSDKICIVMLRRTAFQTMTLAHNYSSRRERFDR